MQIDKDEFNKKGYAILKSLVSNEIIDKIKSELYYNNSENIIKDRIQDAWKDHDIVCDLAFDSNILNILENLYDRKPVPFQTLNFYKGTQQRLHSDQIHFCSDPENFMCGLWIALEDITMENGPLIYYPGSQNIEFKNMQKLNLEPRDYAGYENKIQDIINESRLEPEYGIIKKGDALLWHANLIHGGYKIINENSTRLSMVIHYFFENTKYWTPLASTPTNIVYRDRQTFIKRLRVPIDFNPVVYKSLNIDLQNMTDDESIQHYINHGFYEKRVYKV
jgi:ectoine hydroxylase-related dioxygenase (phytanoyl-CoA dioxygenase family)